MAREDLHFRLRIPADLKARVEESAANAHRSITAEIVARLHASFERSSATNADVVARLRRIEALLLEIAPNPFDGDAA